MEKWWKDKEITHHFSYWIWVGWKVRILIFFTTLFPLVLILVGIGIKKKHNSFFQPFSSSSSSIPDTVLLLSLFFFNAFLLLRSQASAFPFLLAGIVHFSPASCASPIRYVFSFFFVLSGYLYINPNFCVLTRPSFLVDIPLQSLLPHTLLQVFCIWISDSIDFCSAFFCSGNSAAFTSYKQSSSSYVVRLFDNSKNAEWCG